MNSKADKIALLKDIQAGKIDPKEVPVNPLIISAKDEIFYATLIAAGEKEGSRSNVIFCSEAAKAYEEWIEAIKKFDWYDPEEDENYMQNLDIDQKAI